MELSSVKSVHKTSLIQSLQVSCLHQPKPKMWMFTNGTFRVHSAQESDPMKIAIYARVSTNKQDNGNQLIQLREFAAKQQWKVVAEFVDTVTGSGKKIEPRSRQ